MFKLTLFFSLAVASLFINSAEGHGYVNSMILGGKNYSGYLPFDDPYASPPVQRVERHIPSDGPITDLSSADIACNQGGDKPAQLVADVPAGSTVKFQWNRWPSDHLGPVATWLGSCNGDCNSVDLSQVKFFKIDQAGYDASSKQWGSAKLMAQGNTWDSTIPASLTPGEYLLRHEIIALHSTGAAQVYPSCSQLKISGSGTQTPSASELVDITKVYNNNQFPNIWEDFGTFTMPGPNVFAATGSAPSDPSPASPSAGSSSTASMSAPTSSQASSSSITSSPSTSAAASTSTSFVSAPSASATGRCRKTKMVKRHHRHGSLAKRGH